MTVVHTPSLSVEPPPPAEARPETSAARAPSAAHTRPPAAARPETTVAETEAAELSDEELEEVIGGLDRPLVGDDDAEYDEAEWTAF